MTTENKTPAAAEAPADTADFAAAEEALLQQAAAIDSGKATWDEVPRLGDKTETTPATEPKPSDKPTEEPDPSDKAKKAEPDPSENKEPAKEESEFARKREERQRREDERRERSWQNLEAEREKLRAEREEFAREKQARATRPPEPAKCEKGRTADFYEQLAKDAEEDGETGVARAAKAKAAELRARDEAAAKSAAPPEKDGWSIVRAESEIVMRERPELRDLKHPLVEQVNRLINDPETGHLFRAPGGVRAALAVAGLQREAAEAQALREENAKMKAELADLRKRTALPGAGAQSGRPDAPKNLADMPIEDAEKELERQARELSGR